MTTTYQFERGETIVLAVDVADGDGAGADIIAAHMRSTANGGRRPSKNTPVAAQFAITPRVEAGDVPAGWDLVIDATTTKTLALGRYWADAILTQGGRTYILNGVLISIVEPATVLT